MPSKMTLTALRDELGDDCASVNTETSSSSRIQTADAVSNAFTIDVEDYYHVSALASAIPRDTWSQRESRVAASTERLLAMLDEHRVKGTFFVLGWVADHVPALVKRIASLGHEVACH